MGYVLLVLLAAAFWFLFLPKRTLRRMGELPLVKPAIVGVFLLLGWMLFSSPQDPPPPGPGYARGDTQLRAMLE